MRNARRAVCEVEYAVTLRSAIESRAVASTRSVRVGRQDLARGLIRMERLYHAIVFGEAHPQRPADAYASCRNSARTRLSLDKNAPFIVQSVAFARSNNDDF
ncbi:MAG TPA: hypothetical protein VGG48_13560 [Rhizomicrobium sp.]|jgi:hypothetical protein